MIKLSQTGYYALHSVIYSAEQKKSVTIKEISTQEQMSESLLRRIIAELEKAHIIKTMRGRNGGISLAKETNKITVYEILEAIGEEL
jgi:Rrf2 family protein